MTQNVSDDILGKFARKQNDWFARVRDGSLNPAEVSAAIQTIIDRKAIYLARLYTDEKILIGPTKGTVTIAGSGNTFPRYLDSDFKNWKTDKSGNDTSETEALVFEMHSRDGTFKQIFESLGTYDFWQQGQIVEFCRAHCDKLRQEGYGTFFPFKVEEEEFVAYVFVAGGQLEARVRQFAYPDVWRAGRRHRVVVPQLTPIT